MSSSATAPSTSSTSSNSNAKDQPSDMVRVPSSVVRVLMLPGYTQNATIFKGRMGAIKRSLPASVELTHVVDMPTNSSADFDSSATSNSDSPETTPRCWWYAEQTEGYRHFAKMDETLEYLREFIITQGPFDGCWGFSQGAACAAILTALVENPSLHPIFARDGPNWPPAPFKFSILSAGFMPQDPIMAKLFDKPLHTPTVHVLGRADTIVSNDRSTPLAEAFVDARVEWHEGGHHTPSKASWRHFFKHYLELFGPDGPGKEGIDSLPSPSLGTSSGTATPEGGRL
ncbi:BZ3500_MvSof-1268-A1-R1_Chr1-3g01993 [Microbotryum saponariae]|uniref:BZ3500_MvSof-1268-A1-R1_Chr1-3g01993 protein n=1 Tax=Microbotryum saponariae TaxID=289078 RepID=A0A2X0MEX2_9BASI|nr:BZ3500_MvSof-1268-A1-R1_Chr1-3g01993 [Microbotryum saponariae]SCZ95130.1 BZ3501_MvSof-1269-A2-R1_Chr1-3g01595 [Microbotryum saponariae]